MIGRADIEGSKSNVAMDAWLPQASYPCGNFSDTSYQKLSGLKGSIGHAFAVYTRTESQDQASFYPFALREVSVLSELALGHLRYSLTDVPPQSNSPPDNVFGESQHWAEIRDSKRPQGPSVSSVLIRQSDSPSPYQFQILSPKAKHTPVNVHKLVISLVQRQRASNTHICRPRTKTAQASINRPTDPVTGANPFPEVTDLICRLPLPTLFYRLEAVHLGDLMRISDRPENTRHHRNRDALRKQRPYLRLNRFQGVRSLTREENSSSISERCNQVRMRYRASDSYESQSLCLRSTDPHSTTVHVEPFSTSSFAPIPKSIDRFARQNRYGLPSEFPLTSSCSGIVHHLSGRNLYALPLPICMQTRQGHGVTSRQIYIYTDVSHVSRLTVPSLSFRFKVFHLFTRVQITLLGPCFKTGRRGG
ncbi:unnamed protein product [Angiostrongylus costaricensis]|uniref:Regulator of rDNA transcription protein 15 n=1 Tax=Angiostrongylus costaricensis TaxID=334426 RepID=A0A0R3Q2N1_ANGCS|nr:unnamed protein product [Angiostrongylus costaricensis]